MKWLNKIINTLIFFLGLYIVYLIKTHYIIKIALFLVLPILLIYIYSNIKEAILNKNKKNISINKKSLRTLLYIIIAILSIWYLSSIKIFIILKLLLYILFPLISIVLYIYIEKLFFEKKKESTIEFMKKRELFKIFIKREIKETKEYRDIIMYIEKLKYNRKRYFKELILNFKKNPEMYITFIVVFIIIILAIILL